MKPFMHISADDIITVFEDLACHSSTYTSMFDQPVLSFLRDMHLQYGMVHSGYVFYESADQSFDLTQVPEKYAREFQEHVHWLRWGFHAENVRSRYESATYDQVKNDYARVLRELTRITGGAAAIDRVVRTHFYEGNAEAVSAFKDHSEHGVNGLLSAEDNRHSYDLGAEQRDELKRYGRMRDQARDLTFYRTDMRLEHVPDVEGQLKLLQAAEKDLIIFTHEKYLFTEEMKEKIRLCCEFAVGNGYRFGFPMDEID
ncbi:hypothetical protein [Alkalicoccobacillus gibsonii]|uniref:hypothetical protein n=1 Tax=Alkalicoccobacillus gibsonii TaxID=79881 RepID=UPI0019344412|nr:hypothetical protein [Alkalicoccobacillus gibsonii]MBM0065915.1 hypothetical protein [Alkalicoccobacillus gibsonii]